MRWIALILFIVVVGPGHAQIPELPPITGPSNPTPPLPPIGNDPLPPPMATPGRLGPPGGVSSDLELVEKVIAARRTYANSLKDLADHYRKSGDRRRQQMAEEELRQYHRAPHPVYRLELDVPSPKLRPLYNQSEANDLYRWAVSYKDRGIGTEYHDNQRRAEILLQELLTKYPQSTKISDAAYLLGELYEGRAFRQLDRAAAYFERCFQWDPATPTDARLRAARLYDRDLRDRGRAIELYRLVLDQDKSPSRRQEAQRRLSELEAR